MTAEVYTAHDDWQAVHELPEGAILVDDAGYAYQVARRLAPRNETWLNPVSDEYAFIVRRDDSDMRGLRVGSYKPHGNLTLVWTPET